MKDVAELAGVSRTTVSFVINDRPDANIPQETRDKVLTAVAQLGYRPNALAQGLRAKQTHTIGFISDEIATTPFAGDMIQGAQDLAWEHNNIILLVNTGNNQDMKQTAADVMLQRQVDGIIYATMYHREVHPPESLKQVPTVLLDCFDAKHTFPSVVPDEVLGGKQATEYLLQKGHRRIGFVCDFSPVQAKIGRLQGYQQALAQFGVDYDPDIVREGECFTSGGYKAAMEIMQQPDPPTSLFCYNDRMAMGAYDALRKLGLSIPNDVAVVGFDNQELIAGHLYPTLTTMQLPHYDMGKWAAQHLLHLIQHPEARQETTVQHIMTCPLIERESA